MTKTALLIASLALSMGACSTTRYAGPEVTPAIVSSIRTENPGAPLAVELIAPLPAAVSPGAPLSDGAPTAASLVEVKNDETALVLPPDQGQRVVSTAEIKRVVVSRRGEGALTGMGIGALVGVGTGLLVAATYSDPCANSTSWGCVELPRDQLSIVSGLAVGLPAMAVGAVIGALVSAHTSYTFGPPAAAIASSAAN